MAVDYFDRLAEASVKEAIQRLLATGRRPASHSVPPEARVLMKQKCRGRLSETAADKRLLLAIERLKERKEIKAPRTPNVEWTLVDHAEPEAAEPQ